MFGEVLEGYEIVDKVQDVKKAGDKPSVKVVIADSGEIPLTAEELEGIHAEL